MSDLVSYIVNKQYNEAAACLMPMMASIRDRKLNEMKKIIQAKTIYEGEVVDLGKKREDKNIQDFHKKFMNNLKSKSTEMAKRIQSHVEAGKFPLKVGTRFHTDHTRENGQGPWRVTGYHVDPKNPEGRYGYHVERDGEQSMHMIRDPNLEKLHGQEKWSKLQAGITPLTGPQKMDEEFELDEAARFKIVKARFRGGKLQRRKKVSTQAGFTFRGGKMTRMSPAERRRRKMGQRKGKLKRKATIRRALMKRQRTMRRRKALGL